MADPEGAFVARLAIGPGHDGAMAMTEFLTAFASLSPEHREVLTLVGAPGFSYEETLGFSYEAAAVATTLAIGQSKAGSAAHAPFWATARCQPRTGPPWPCWRRALARWNLAEKTAGGAVKHTPCSKLSALFCCWHPCRPSPPRPVRHRLA